MRKHLLRFWKRLLVAIGLMSSLISLYVYFKPKDADIFRVQIESVEQLTSDAKASDPDLVGVYYFNKERVAHLWRARILLRNDGSRTIIGKGPKSDLISENLSFKVPDDYRILKFEQFVSAVPHKSNWSENSFSFNFSQWKKREFLWYHIYIETPTNHIKKDFLSEALARQISNFDVKFERYQPSDEAGQPPSTILNPTFRQITYLVALLFLVCMTIWIGLMTILTPIYYFKKQRWIKENADKYEKFLEKLKELNPTEKEFYLENPKRLPGFIWRRFSEPRYPSSMFDYETESLSDFILSMFALIMIFNGLFFLILDKFYAK